MKVLTKQAKTIGDAINVNWDKVDLEQFRRGIEVEFEHGTVYASTNITDDDLIMTAKIALAHLRELPDYYTKLDKMEQPNELTEDFAEPPNTTAKGITLEMTEEIARAVGIDFSKYQIEDFRYGIIEELGLMQINTMDNVTNETLGKASYRADENLSQDPAYYTKDMSELEQQHADPISQASQKYELNKMIESIVEQELRKI